MAAKYLSHFPKPLLDDLVKGRLLPVIGAGMSLNALLPAGKKMPQWGDLATLLGKELPDYSPSGILDAISAYEHEFGRTKLIERLIEILHIKDVQPGPAHKEFCQLPFDIVCTTNFDFLLEQQYGLIPHHVHPAVDEDQLSINIGNPGTLLLKLHGDLRHPKRLVVTEIDYDGFLTNYPLIATYLSNQLITKTALFIGYSLDDPDFRQIWHVVTSRLGKTRRMAYAILVNAKPGDVARFERRGVKVINLPGSRERYGEVLAEAFRELREYRRDHAVEASRVTEEQPLRELLLPRNTSTRLCFFSVPLDVLPFYRERIFPFAEEVGFVPVTATDVITPGDNVSGKIDTLIDRSAVMIVDAGSRYTRAELSMAIARIREIPEARHRRQRFHLVIVSPDPQNVAFPLESVSVIHRPDLLTEDPEAFINLLNETLRMIAADTVFVRADEPTRLFEAKEYRAAVIAAMTLLEATLRERLKKGDWTDVRKPMSMRQLVDKAIERGILPSAARELIASWTQLRDRAVHTAAPIAKDEARHVVDGVAGILRFH